MMILQQVLEFEVEESKNKNLFFPAIFYVSYNFFCTFLNLKKVFRSASDVRNVSANTTNHKKCSVTVWFLSSAQSKLRYMISISADL